MTSQHSDFLNTSQHQLNRFGHTGGSGTHLSPRNEMRLEGKSENLWREGEGTKQHWFTSRTAAYLAAYIEFLTASEIPGIGITTAQGYIWLDKGVMCALLNGECVTFENESFHLTDKGSALIAPFVPPARYQGAVN